MHATPPLDSGASAPLVAQTSDGDQVTADIENVDAPESAFDATLLEFVVDLAVEPSANQEQQVANVEAEPTVAAPVFSAAVLNAGVASNQSISPSSAENQPLEGLEGIVEQPSNGIFQQTTNGVNDDSNSGVMATDTSTLASDFSDDQQLGKRLLQQVEVAGSSASAVRNQQQASEATSITTQGQPIQTQPSLMPKVVEEFAESAVESDGIVLPKVSGQRPNSQNLAEGLTTTEDGIVMEPPTPDFESASPLDTASSNTVRDVSIGSEAPQVAERMKPTMEGDVKASIVNQVSETIVSAKGSQREGVIQLEVVIDPPELGKVTIEMTTKHDQLDAKLIVSEHTTLDAIKDSLPKLFESLSEAGVELDDLQLESSTSDSRNRRQADSEQQDTAKLEESRQQNMLPALSANNSINILA